MLSRQSTRRMLLSVWAGMALTILAVCPMAAGTGGKEAAGSNLPVASISCDNTGALAGTVVNGLQIGLAADRTVYRVGEEIRFTFRFMNRGDRSFRIFDPYGFWSADVIIHDDTGNEIPWRGGYQFFSPKVNVYVGTTREVLPGGCFEKRLRALIDRTYAVVFAEPQRNKPLDADARARLGVPSDLPDDFIGTGRIFELRKPGVYRVSFHYAKKENDGRVWQMDPDPLKNAELLRDVWTGAVDSNPVTIEIR
jgi:hypothetical protein